MSVRLKRLYADSVRISQIFSENPYISVISATGTPPEKYEIEFRIKGLEQKGSEVVSKDRHLVEIALPYHYPREAPKCRMLTPIFHPNIAPHTVCIGDHWSAGESLADLIVRIGEMICFQSYNIKSPLNGEAAKWAEENISGLPIDTIDLDLEKRLEDIIVDKKEVEHFKAAEIQKKEEKTGVIASEDVESIRSCSNCQAKGANVRFFTCDEGHVVCADCIIECQTCGKTICLLCSFARCSICEMIICNQCQVSCPSCHRVICKNHAVKCAQCQAELCSECISICSHCGKYFCKSHIKTKNLCEKCAANEENVLITYEDSADTEVGKAAGIEMEKNKYNGSSSDTVGVEYCKKCGHKIEYKTTLYCTACGYKLR
ncbi:MAG: hypothetical protein JSV88_02855 [Candidatus Aminicenantes bacterium]|nr:MAG: hypothetical protein JSV88_02855 [Candidatus Aminicenantes bacterium]